MSEANKYDPLDAKSVADAFVREQEDGWDEEFIEQDISLLAEMLAPMQTAIATRDEQIAALTAELETSRQECAAFEHALTVACDARDAAREALLWIPVSERLPEFYVDILMFNANDCGRISVGYLARSWGEPPWTFCDAGDDVSVSCVTHWMHLPEPPK